jgi:hypothetical protein
LRLGHDVAAGDVEIPLPLGEGVNIPSPSGRGQGEGEAHEMEQRFDLRTNALTPTLSHGETESNPLSLWERAD